MLLSIVIWKKTGTKQGKWRDNNIKCNEHEVRDCKEIGATWTNNKRFSNGGCQTLHLLCCLWPGLSPTYPTCLVKIWRPEGFVLYLFCQTSWHWEFSHVHRTGCSTRSFVRPFLDFKTKKPWGVMLGQSPNRLTKWRKRSQWSQQITSPTGWKERTPSLMYSCWHPERSIMHQSVATEHWTCWNFHLSKFYQVSWCWS